MKSANFATRLNVCITIKGCDLGTHHDSYNKYNDKCMDCISKSFPVTGLCYRVLHVMKASEI